MSIKKNNTDEEWNKRLSPKEKYKIKYNSNPIFCSLCSVYVRADGMDKHKQTKKHLCKAEGKFCVRNNNKDYYYDLSKREKHQMSTKLKDPEFKKKHYSILNKKVECEICGSVVSYSSMWRHKESMKCRLFKK